MQQQGRYEAPVPLFLRPATGLALGTGTNLVGTVPPRNMSQREVRPDTRTPQHLKHPLKIQAGVLWYR